MQILRTAAEDLFGLFFPRLCPACGRSAPAPRELLCLSCQVKLPQTGFHLEADNAFEERFWGRIPLVAGAALYHFVKGGRTQYLIHQLKYAGNRQVGQAIGRYYGRLLRECPRWQDPELILPVPLHPRKRHRRGYNQSALFAAGLAESMRLPWRDDVLRRRHYTASQTRKSRTERMENVLKAFVLTRPQAVAARHVLLVDDVLTTGATLEACGRCLLKAPDVQLSMVTIGIAQMN